MTDTSQQQKRHLLWNMIDPGDPYDIRQSLIARIPGDTKIFMGDHIEIVLLFQSAEIQRLHESLAEYKLKFKEVERVQLDRHSFQVQIRQLTERCGENEAYRQEVGKLKEFIRRQGLQLEDAKKKEVQRDQGLQESYKEALGRLEMLIGENSQLTREVERLESLRLSREKDLQELRVRSDSERAEWRSQRSQFQSMISGLNQRMFEYQQRINQNAQIEAQLNQYDKKLKMLSKQLDRIQLLLNQKSRDNNQLQHQNKTNQLAIQRKQSEVHQLGVQVQELRQQLVAVTAQARAYEIKLAEFQHTNAKVMEYQQTLALLTQEVQRLSVLIANKERDINQLTSRNSQLEGEINSLKRQYRDVEASLSDLQLQRQRLLGESTHLSRSKNTQIIDLKQRISSLSIDNQNLRRKQQNRSGQFQQKLGSLMDQVSRLNGVLKVKLGEISVRDTDISQLEVRLQQGDVQKLDLRRKLSEATVLERRNQDLRDEIRKLKLQLDRAQALMKASVQELDVENSQLKRKLREQSEMGSKTMDLERTISGLKSDLEAAGVGLRSRNDENNKLRMELGDLKQVNVRLTEEFQGARRRLSDSINVSSQNQQLKSRMITLSHELQRLNVVLRDKINEINDLATKLRRVQDERDDILSRFDGVKRTQSQLKMSQSGNQQKISYLESENEILRSKLTNLETQYLSSRSQADQKILMLNKQIQRLGQQLRNKESELSMLQEQYRIDITETSQRVLRDSGHRITTLEDQLRRIRELLKSKSEQAIRLETDLRDRETQLIRVRNQSSQLNSKVSQLTRIRNAYEESMLEITRLTSKNNEMESKLTNQGSTVSRVGIYEQKIFVLSAEVQRLNTANNRLGGQIQKIKRDEVQFKRKLSMVDNDQVERFRAQVIGLKKENTELIKKLEQTGGQFRMQIDNLTVQLNQRDTEFRSLEKSYRQLQQHNKQVSLQNGEFEKRIGPMSIEIQRLNDVLKNKLQENDQLIGEYNRLVDSQVGSQQNDQQRLSTYVVEIDRLNGVLGRKVQELSHLTEQYNDLRETYNHKLLEIQDGQNKIGMMATEIQRLNFALKQQLDGEKASEQTYLHQIQRLNNLLKLKVMESQEWQQQATKSGQLLRQEYNKLQILYHQGLKDCDGYKSKITVFQERFVKIDEEFRKLNDIISNLRKENEFLKQESYNLKFQLNQFQQLSEMNKKLSQEIDRLNKINGQLEEDSADLKIHLSDESSLQRRLNEYLTLFVVLFAEIESLRVRVKDKEKECEQVRRNSLAPLRI